MTTETNKITYCEAHAESGDYSVPATTNSKNPDFSGYNLCAECAAEYDSRMPIRSTKYYEIPLYWTEGAFHAHTDRGSLGEGWAMDTDLIHEAANGAQCDEITESDLPAPLINNLYPGLRIFRLGGVDNFFGIAEL